MLLCQSVFLLILFIVPLLSVQIVVTTNNRSLFSTMCPSTGLVRKRAAGKNTTTLSVYEQCDVLRVCCSESDCCCLVSRSVYGIQWRRGALEGVQEAWWQLSNKDQTHRPVCTYAPPYSLCVAVSASRIAQSVFLFGRMFLPYASPVVGFWM